MTAKDRFAIAVRVVGLLVILAALLYFVDAVIMFINPYLLRGAPHVIRFAFPEKGAKSDATPKV